MFFSWKILFLSLLLRNNDWKIFRGIDPVTTWTFYTSECTEQSWHLATSPQLSIVKWVKVKGIIHWYMQTKNTRKKYHFRSEIFINELKRQYSRTTIIKKLERVEKESARSTFLWIMIWSEMIDTFCYVDKLIYAFSVFSVTQILWIENENE